MKLMMEKRSVKLLTLVLLLILALGVLNFDGAQVSANTRYGRLTGVNWFGCETGNYTFHGLWSRDYKSVLQQIKDLGFNCIRIPWCNAMIGKVPSSIQINQYGIDAYTKQTGLNMDLEGLDALGVLDKVIDHAATLGLYIILDNHSRAADGYMSETLWYTAAYPESKWISDWVMLVNRYKSKSNVIGADLNNEPHGNLGTGMKPPASWGYNVPGYGDTDWKAAAERCGQAILNANPNMLILVEGVEQAEDGTGYWWGGNLRDVRKYPITGIPAGNLVYSPHEYGSGVYMQTWFSDPTFPNNMPAIWDDRFYFIKKQNIAPLLFGEFGIKESEAANPNSIDYKWLTTFMDYVGRDCSWTFWCMNPNSGDTGGILQDDWVSVNTAKYNILKPYLAGGGPTSTPTPTIRTATPTPTQPATPTPTRLVTPTTVTPTPSRRVTPTPVRRVTPTPTRRGVTPTPTRRATSTPTQRLIATPTPTPATSGGYVVSYVFQSDWGTGATVNVVITNNTTQSVNGWTLAFTFPGNQTITNMWNATYTQSGASVSVKDGGFNANIPANGGLVNFGFNINYSGTNAKPSGFTLNGTACQVL
ncbi:MAG: cellulase family glycosylhydrolase [Firmicutes bacterium]|nr:cellulase family glycosylhydrolase [Bacillota bacterium]